MSDLNYATLATVSRCGMVWFSEEVVDMEILFENYLSRLNTQPLNTETTSYNSISVSNHNHSRFLEIQQACAQFLNTHMVPDGLVSTTLDYAMKNVEHIMEPTKQRLLLAFFSMMNFSVKQLLEYDSKHQDFPLSVIFISIFNVNMN